jgi:hypothetical protein
MTIGAITRADSTRAPGRSVRAHNTANTAPMVTARAVVPAANSAVLRAAFQKAGSANSWR